MTTWGLLALVTVFAISWWTRRQAAKPINRRVEIRAEEPVPQDLKVQRQPTESPSALPGIRILLESGSSPGASRFCIRPESGVPFFSETDASGFAPLDEKTLGFGDTADFLVACQENGLFLWLEMTLDTREVRRTGRISARYSALPAIEGSCFDSDGRPSMGTEVWFTLRAPFVSSDRAKAEVFWKLASKDRKIRIMTDSGGSFMVPSLPLGFGIVPRAGRLVSRSNPGFQISTDLPQSATGSEQFDLVSPTKYSMTLRRQVAPEFTIEVVDEHGQVLPRAWVYFAYDSMKGPGQSNVVSHSHETDAAGKSVIRLGMLTGQSVESLSGRRAQAAVYQSEVGLHYWQGILDLKKPEIQVRVAESTPCEDLELVLLRAASEEPVAGQTVSLGSKGLGWQDFATVTTDSAGAALIRGLRRPSPGWMGPFPTETLFVGIQEQTATRLRRISKATSRSWSADELGQIDLSRIPVRLESRNIIELEIIE